MLGAFAALLQGASTESTTVLAVVIVLILIGIGYLVLRAGIDRATGAHRECASYQILRRPDGTIVIEVTGTPVHGELVELAPEQMGALVDAVHARNEMRLHSLVLPDGEEVASEDHEVEDGMPRAIVVEDSRGMIRLGVGGLIDAKPPLDDAVKDDLVEVLTGILEAPGEAS